MSTLPSAAQDQLRQLVQEIDNGAVKMLIILGGNPAYNAPADLRLDMNRFKVDADDKEGRKVPLRVHLGHYQDETAEIVIVGIGFEHHRPVGERGPVPGLGLAAAAHPDPV